MSDDVRSGIRTADDIHTTNVPDAFKAFADEVRRRNQKPQTTPVTIAQKLQPAEFNTAMVHFYRGEVARSNIWRNRLDATTNWAVITAGATLSFVFSSPDNPHFAIPINSILVSIFLFMEARRYRYYEVWANRVRVLETGYFAPMLSQRAIPPDARGLLDAEPLRLRQGWHVHDVYGAGNPKAQRHALDVLGVRCRAGPDLVVDVADMESIEGARKNGDQCVQQTERV